VSSQRGGATIGGPRDEMTRITMAGLVAGVAAAAAHARLHHAGGRAAQGTFTCAFGDSAVLTVQQGGAFPYDITQGGGDAPPLLASGTLALHLAGVFVTPAAGLTPGQPSQTAGTDALGPWTALTVPWSAGSVSVAATFRCYGQAVVFELALPDGATGINTETVTGGTPRRYDAARAAAGLAVQAGGGPPGEFNSSSTPSLHFPSWRYTGTPLQSAGTGYLEWNGRFSNDGTNWGTALNQFVGGQTGGPLVLFNLSAVTAQGALPAVVVGPLDHFKSTILGLNPEYASQPGMRLVAGVQGYVVNVDAGYVQRVAVTQSDAGIAAAVQRFGSVLRREWNTSRMAGDPNVERLTYWTDNGAVYDCDFWNAQGTGGVTADQILVPLAQYHRSLGLKVATYQLDPWWFPMDATGATNWTVGRHFNTSLNAIGLPYTLYSSYWSITGGGSQMPQWDFVQSLEFNVGWMYGHIGRVAADQSRAFYTSIMTLGKSWGACVWGGGLMQDVHGMVPRWSQA
jgi:hypothetical protein